MFWIQAVYIHIMRIYLCIFLYTHCSIDKPEQYISITFLFYYIYLIHASEGFHMNIPLQWTLTSFLPFTYNFFICFCFYPVVPCCALKAFKWHLETGRVKRQAGTVGRRLYLLGVQLTHPIDARHGFYFRK